MFQLIQGLKILEKYITIDTYWEVSLTHIIVRNVDTKMSPYDYRALDALGWIHDHNNVGTWSIHEHS